MPSPVSPGFVKIYVKKRLVFDRLTFPQRDMFRLGTAGLVAVKKRVRAALNLADAPASPLRSNSWIRIKKAKGLRPVRDLWGTGLAAISRSKKRKARLKHVGHMLDNLRVRTVSDNLARSGFAQYAARVKARANQRREPWLGFSPKDQAYVLQIARRIFSDAVKRLVRTKAA